MTARTKRLIASLKSKYRDEPEGFRALLPGPSDAGPHTRHPSARVGAGDAGGRQEAESRWGLRWP